MTRWTMDVVAEDAVLLRALLEASLLVQRAVDEDWGLERFTPLYDDFFHRVLVDHLEQGGRDWLVRGCEQAVELHRAIEQITWQVFVATPEISAEAFRRAGRISADEAWAAIRELVGRAGLPELIAELQARMDAASHGNVRVPG